MDSNVEKNVEVIFDTNSTTTSHSSGVTREQLNKNIDELTKQETIDDLKINNCFKDSDSMYGPFVCNYTNATIKDLNNDLDKLVESDLEMLVREANFKLQEYNKSLEKIKKYFEKEIGEVILYDLINLKTKI